MVLSLPCQVFAGATVEPHYTHKKAHGSVPTSIGGMTDSYEIRKRLPFRSWLTQVSHRVVEEVLLPQAASLPDAHQGGVGRGSLRRLVPIRDLSDYDTRPQRSLRSVVVPFNSFLLEEGEEHTTLPPKALE